MTSYLGGGLATLDRWEGLKEWHRRHQDLLGESSSDPITEGCKNQYQSSLLNLVTERNQLQLKDFTQQEDDLHGIDVLGFAPAKPDLSIIQEVDEDSRSKDGDQDDLRSRQGMGEIKRTGSVARNENEKSVPIKPSDAKCSKLNGPPVDKSQNSVNTSEIKVIKRPFLRKGQGLVRYNLQTEDLKRPYQNARSKQFSGEKHNDQVRQGRFAMKCLKPSKDSRQTSQKQLLNKFIKAPDLSAPMQRLVLSIPSQKSNAVEGGTWSQVFGADADSNGNAVQVTGKELSRQQLLKDDFPNSIASHNREAKTMMNVMSPKRKRNVCSKQDSSPEEDQESLAAYLDLEQHVGNASFCSTSSKVDRLLAKSADPSIHQSNPDTITQSKQLSPCKTGRRFFYSGHDGSNSREDHHSMWSTTDLENLVRARARRSGSLIKARLEATQTGTENSQINKICSPEESEKGVTKSSPNALKAATPEPQVVDWMAEALGPSRKPHLMKTMPGIDLDSSLVRNALAPILHLASDESGSDTESSSSKYSSEDDSEQDLSAGMNNCPESPSKLSGEVTTKFQVPQEMQPVPQKSFWLADDISLEEINHQIETHLSDLRKEIETLQAAKSKTHKYISGLEKKVLDLEQTMALDARSYNKQLENEREAASKRLTEAQTKFLKEKQALQRTIREERRKAPDPLSHQELLRLKQEVSQWEEKWRSDRAKARGLESNLRIQITNLKRENEKLKEENSKLLREKETALSTAKARSASNTRVINSIAQHLGNSKPKVSIVREESNKLRKDAASCASNVKAFPNTRQTKKQNPVATIENFPELPRIPNEWSSDEEIDLGKETSEEDDIEDTEEVQPVKISSQIVSIDPEPSHDGKGASAMQISPYETIDVEVTQAKYDAIFGKSGHLDLQSTSSKDIARDHRAASGQIDLPLNQGNHEPSSNNIETEKFVKSVQHADGKVEQIKENGTRVITYPDGTWERHSSSGSVMTVPSSGWPVHISYFNGDQLEKLRDGTTRYFYAKTNVWQTTYPDGHEELRYPSGHVEHRNQDGSVKVVLPNRQSDKRTFGTVSETSSSEISVEKLPNGDTLILLPTGERELHTKEFMKKDFLDGTVKFLHKDGSQETRYPSGRIRVKDAQGNLLKDTMQSA